MYGRWGVSKYIMEVKVIGQMDNTIDHTFESANRVYDKNGLAPTINTCGGGGLQPKVIDEVKELGFMDNAKVDMNPKLLGGIGEKWGDKQYRQGNRVYDANGVAMALTAQPLGNNGGNSYMYLTEEKSIVEMRGRNPENPSDRKVGAPTEQRLEPNSQGICNTLTSVTKDNLVMEIKAIDEQNMCVRDDTFENLTTDGSSPKHNNRVMEYVETKYRIRKLTPRECYRLMAVPEKDIDKMLEVNSNTQCYKQAGNSIVVNCLIAIFSQMGIQGIPRWNDGLSEKYK